MTDSSDMYYLMLLFLSVEDPREIKLPTLRALRRVPAGAGSPELFPPRFFG